MRRIKVGLIGTGDVLVKYYLPVLAAADSIELTAVCSANESRAARLAAALDLSEAYGDYLEMLAKTSAELIVNLTPAQLHYPMNLAILRAGKHLYSEKPLARTVAEVDDLLAAARTAGVQVATAPSVMLDPAVAALRAVLDSGGVGAVAFATATAFQGGPLTASYEARRAELIAAAGLDVLGRPEDRPDQAWFYQKGGGPLYDYGIYLITLLTGLLGPVRRVTALSGVRTPERTIGVGRGAGRSFATDEDDNTLLLLDFGQSVFASVCASWHGTAPSGPQVELVCQRGTVSLPMGNPGDRRLVRVHRGQGWEDVPVKGTPWTVATGLPHFAERILDGQPSPVTLAHARHVIEVLEKTAASAQSGRVQDLATSFEPPALPAPG